MANRLRPGWTRSNTTFAVMTHFLEDRPPLADIWPANELIWGGIFASPKFVTDEVRQLPRAAELSARWQVPIPTIGPTTRPRWPCSGASPDQSNDQLDTQGTITIDRPHGLKAST